jgi:hypothetical protein
MGNPQTNRLVKNQLEAPAVWAIQADFTPLNELANNSF